MKIVPSITTMAYSAIAGLVVGLGLTAWLSSSWYAPRLELANAKLATAGQALEKQNKAVKRLEADGKAMTARLKTAQANASKRSAARQTQAQAILATPLPPGVDQCDAASDLIRRELAK